ncbi:unnamed protein product, partial [Larinioides sclopetarius]
TFPILSNSTQLEFVTENQKLEFPLQGSPVLQRNRLSPVEAELLERAIFEFIKGLKLHNVIMFHKAAVDDGLLLSELLYSNSVHVTHIEVLVVSKAVKILEHFFTTVGSSNTADILLISLEDGEEIDQLLMSLVSNKRIKTLVVGNLQRWQDRLLEVKAYEMYLIVIMHCKESVQPVDGSSTKEDDSIYCFESEDVYTVWQSFLSDEGSQKMHQVAVWKKNSKMIKMEPEIDTIIVRLALVEYWPFIRIRMVNGTVTLNDCVLKRLLNEFAKRQNLKFKLLYGHKWGGKVETDWTGAIGMVLREEADMIPFLPVTESRESVLDFTKPKAFINHGIL